MNVMPPSVHMSSHEVRLSAGGRRSTPLSGDAEPKAIFSTIVTEEEEELFDFNLNG